MWDSHTALVGGGSKIESTFFLIPTPSPWLKQCLLGGPWMWARGFPNVKGLSSACQIDKLHMFHNVVWCFVLSTVFRNVENTLLINKVGETWYGGTHAEVLKTWHRIRENLTWSQRTHLLYLNCRKIYCILRLKKTQRSSTVLTPSAWRIIPWRA